MPESSAGLARHAWLRWAGLALLCVSLFYLARSLGKLDLDRLIRTMGRGEWFAVAACTLIYGASLGLLAQAWGMMAARPRHVSFPTALAVYGPGAVAKYLPGSVFQYASRHLIGIRHGMNHANMAKASFVEAGLHVAVALALSVVLVAGGGMAVIGLAALCAALLAVRSSSPFVSAFAMQTLFFCLFVAIVILLGSIGNAASNAERLAGLFLFAWVFGFLLPVAPGGIGVREAAFLAIAAPFESIDVIVLVALLARLVGIGGDCLVGFVGYWALTGLSARENKQASG